jgi:cytochrome c oxidase subunit 2
MLTRVHTGLDPVEGVWWKPAHRTEKIWVAIAFAWCMVLFAMMPLWHWKGGQNPSGERTRVDPKAFYARTVRFATQYKVGDDKGIPIVQPPPGADVYLVGLTFQWYPILKLQQGKE